MTDAHSQIASFLEGLPEPHILCDAEYRIVSANAAYRRQFDGASRILGRTCYDVSHHYAVPCDQAGESCPMAMARQSRQKERVLHLHHTAQGQSYVNIELTPLFDAQGELSGYIEKVEGVAHAHHRPHSEGLIGRSLAFRKMLDLINRVAPSTASVLLLGETGTGKDLAAQALHAASKRAHKPLVPVDCSSLTETLFESELFGHERGAFTDAHKSKAGLVESANGGTLFLDEVGDIPLTMQVKLLRLLETGTYRRVGSVEQRQVDVRIVAATHRNLRDMVREGRFREDLYHRISTFPIHIPALRERREDIKLLAASLLQRINPERTVMLASDAQHLLEAQPFPGNVRELRNLLERAVLLTAGQVITAHILTEALSMDAALNESRPLQAASVPNIATSPVPAKRYKQRLLTELQSTAASFQGSRAELAEQLGVSERTLYRLLQKLPT